jgi:hypothetical protein
MMWDERGNHNGSVWSKEGEVLLASYGTVQHESEMVGADNAIPVLQRRRLP